MQRHGMIHIVNDKECCGCGACSQACPAGCISMHPSREGFLYPVIDESACIGCGKCEKVCPMRRRNPWRQPSCVIAAASRDDHDREDSSSGGMFTELAKKVLGAGGVVYGVSFDCEWNPVPCRAENVNELSAIRRSKYAQADMSPVFRDCLDALNSGREVLFSGTPCQISGLNGFLGRNYPNLVLVDVVCHSVPSPAVWKRYLAEIPEHHEGYEVFRGSSERTYNLSCRHRDNPFMKAFLQGLISRPSCADCPFRGGASSADITLGDFWGIDRLKPDLSAECGWNAVVIHSDKGMKLISSLDIVSIPSSLDEASMYNSALVKSPLPSVRRGTFFDSFEGARSVTELMRSLVSGPSMKQRLQRMKSSFRAILKGENHRAAAGTAPGRKERARVECCLESGEYSITGVSFRDKSSGWKDYRMTIAIKLNDSAR